MPGLSGIITSNPSHEKKQDIEVMVDALIHGPLYSNGTFIDEQMGIYVGWACHANSFMDCMPIWNENKDMCLLFFGEDFSDPDIKTGLRANGHDFDARNASYLIHLFEEQGMNAIKLLNGFFHGLLIDFSRNIICLFNDRFGMQRVYYYKTRDSFFFSAEAKCLLKINPKLREFNFNGLGQLLTTGCIFGGESLYKNISVLPGASALTFHDGQLDKTEQYFNYQDWENRPALGTDEYYRTLRETFQSLLPKYFNEGINLGVSLTGGLDTRIIMSNYPAVPDSLPCYTFGSMYRDGFDVKIARRVAEACKQPHLTIKLGKDFLDEFPGLAQRAAYISDGYLDVASGAAELFANNKARDIALIRMTGSHGSEILRSIRGLRYKLANQEMLDDEVVEHMYGASEIFMENSMNHNLTFAAFVEAPLYNYNRVSLEQSLVIKRTPFMDNDLLKLVYQAPGDVGQDDRMSLQLVRDGYFGLGDILTNRGRGGASYSIVSGSRQILHELLKQAEFGYDFGLPQILSRIDSYLSVFHFEKLFLGWNSFYHFRTWFRDELASYVTEILLERRTMERGVFKKGYLEKIVSGHLKHRYNYASEINTALTLELTYRCMLDHT